MSSHSDFEYPDLHDPCIIAEIDPGAIGARKLWLDISDPDAPLLKIRSDANDDWTTIGGGGGGDDNDSAYLVAASNLSDVANGALALSHIGGQASSVKLSAFDSLANSAGALTNDGAGNYSWAAPVIWTASSETPAGSDQMGATEPVGNLVIAAGDGAAGIKLVAARRVYMVFNNGGDALKVYGAGSSSDSFAGSPSPYSLVAGKSAVFFWLGETGGGASQWGVVLSA